MVKTTPRFERSKDALYNAFFKGTLASGTCMACAVGNMVAHGMNATIFRSDNKYEPLFGCNADNAYWNFILDRDYSTEDEMIQDYPKEVEQLYRHTGYTLHEIIMIEKAFESHTRIDHYCYDEFTEEEILQDQYNGLCAVFDVLMKLDNIGEDDIKDRLRARLTNPVK